MIVRLRRVIQRNLIGTLSFGISNFRQICSLNAKSVYLFSKRSAPLITFVGNAQSSQKQTKMPNTIEGELDSSLNENSLKNQNQQFLNVLYQNPYIDQDNERQIIEQGFLAFYTSHVIRRIKFKEYYLRLPHQSIGQYILELKDKIKINSDENIGFLSKNIEQFFDAFKVGKGIRLPKVVFGQNRIQEVKFYENRQVFNVTSLNRDILQFANQGDLVYQDDFGIGKSISLALNNYLTFLVSKMLMLLKENPKEKIKQISNFISKHYYLFEEFHKQNTTHTPTVDLLVKDFNLMHFQFYYQFNVGDTWDQIIDKMLIQCPELKLNFKISEIIQIKNKRSLSEAQVKDFFNNLRKHFSQKDRHFVFIVDEGDLYYRRLNNIASILMDFQSALKLDDFKDALQIFVSKSSFFKQQEKQFKQIQHWSKFLKVFYGYLIQSNVKLCCSGLSIRIYKPHEFDFPVSFWFNPFYHSGVTPTSLISQENKQIFDWKKMELWRTFWFQIEDAICRGVSKKRLNEFQNKMQLLKLKSIFYGMFIQKDENDEVFKWVSEINQLTMRQALCKPGIQQQFKQLRQLILGFTKEEDDSEVVNSFKKLAQKCFIKIDSIHIAQEYYRRIRKMTSQKKEDIYEIGAFLLDYLKQMIKQRQNIINNQMKVSLEQIQHLFDKLLPQLSEQALGTLIRAKRCSGVLRQLLKLILIQLQIQFRIENQTIIVQNPKELLAYTSKKSFNKCKKHQDYKLLFALYLSELQEAKINLKAGQSLAFRLSNKQQNKNVNKSQSRVFDFFIATKYQDGRIVLRTVDLAEKQSNIVGRLCSPSQFYQKYLENNRQFNLGYDYQHWVVCTGKLANKYNYPLNGKLKGNKRKYVCHVIPLQDIQNQMKQTYEKKQDLEFYKLLIGRLTEIKKDRLK